MRDDHACLIPVDSLRLEACCVEPGPSYARSEEIQPYLARTRPPAATYHAVVPDSTPERSPSTAPTYEAKALCGPIQSP